MITTIADARARNLACAQVLFYVFETGKPDGTCLEGRLQDINEHDVDDPECYFDEGLSEIPCPLCCPVEYEAYKNGGLEPVRAIYNLIKPR